MKNRYLLLLLLMPALACGQAASRATQKAQVDSLLPTNGTNSITAEKLRTVIKASIDSGYNPIDDGSPLLPAAIGDTLQAHSAALDTFASNGSAYYLARGNHTGTQSADTVTDGTSNKAFTAAEKTKLAGIADGATANSSDAQLLARANHTGTQALGTLSQSGATTGQVPKWNGSIWAPADDTVGGASVTRQTFSNAAYAIPAGTTVAAQTGTMSASRAVTLPAASGYAPGAGILVVDESGTVSATNSLVLTRAGSDTINGGTTYTLGSAYTARFVWSDGTSKWTLGRVIPDEIGKIAFGSAASFDTLTEKTIASGGSVGTERGVVLARVAGLDVAVAVIEDNGSAGGQNPSLRLLGLDTSSGGHKAALVETTATTVNDSTLYEFVVLNNASAVTYNLLPLAISQKAIKRFKNIGAGAVTIDPSGAETIFDTSSVSTITLTTGQSAILIAGAASWFRY